MKKNDLDTAFETAVDLLLCFLFTFLIFGFFDIRKLGVYSDDWERHSSYSTYTKNNPIADSISFTKDFPFVLYRAPQLPLFTLTAFINNSSDSGVSGFAYVNFILNFFIIFVLYSILKIQYKDRRLAIFSSFFIGSIFGRDSTIFWGSTQPILLSVLLFLIIILLLVKDRGSLLVYFLVTIFSVWSYELSIVIPIFILLYGYIKKRRVDKETIRKAFVTSLSVLLVVIFKFYIFPIYITPSLKASSLSDAIILPSLRNVLYSGRLFLEVNPLVNYIRYSTKIIFKYVVETVVFLSSIFFLLLPIGHKVNKINNEESRNDEVLFCGLFLFTLSTIVINILGFNTSVLGKENRVLILPVIGFGFIVLYFLALIKNKLLLFIFLILLDSSGDAYDTEYR
mgnify:FL=1